MFADFDFQVIFGNLDILWDGMLITLLWTAVAIVGGILEQDWINEPRTNRPITGLSITSDGFVITAANNFLGSASDLDNNIADLLDYTGVTPDERIAWNTAYQRHVTDWR